MSALHFGGDDDGGGGDGTLEKNVIGSTFDGTFSILSTKYFFFVSHNIFLPVQKKYMHNFFL